ncbi:MAG: hypothetical protein R2881_02420 [Eubacteriales bacterium]
MWLKIFSGGTDNHLMLVDLRDTDVTGQRVQTLLDSAHITANRNAIPFDTRNKLETSGMLRHARLDHARHEGTGDAADRQHDCENRQRRRSGCSVGQSRSVGNL